jgi:tetratricopeptide (TPR) repeat protein
MRAEAEGMQGDRHRAASLLLQADSLLAQAEAFDRRWPEPVVLRGWLAYDQSGLPMAGSPAVGTSGGRSTDAWLRDGLKHAERALAIVPGYPAALELRGGILWRVSNLAATGLFRDITDPLASAEANLRAAVASPSPFQARAWSLLSTVLQVEGKYAEANLAAQRAYTADAYFRDADDIVLRLWLTSFELGREAEARRWCERGQRSFPDNWLFRLCELTMMVGFPSRPPDVPAAWRVADEMLAVAPADIRTWLGPRAQALAAGVVAHAGMRDSALRVVARARSQAPDDAELLYFESLVRLNLALPRGVRGFVAHIDQAVVIGSAKARELAPERSFAFLEQVGFPEQPDQLAQSELRDGLAFANLFQLLRDRLLIFGFEFWQCGLIQML